MSDYDTTTRPELLDYMAAAALLGISKRQLEGLVARREIRFLKIGNWVRFRRTDIDHFLTSNTMEPNTGDKS